MDGKKKKRRRRRFRVRSMPATKSLFLVGPSSTNSLQKEKKKKKKTIKTGQPKEN